jgi:hypothetical protein
MKPKFLLLAVASLGAIAGCSTTSSSRVFEPSAALPVASPVFVSATTVPAGLAYKAIGAVEVEAHAGYDHVEALYPRLAAEARKIGANAVFNAGGGHRLQAFSWAAPYVSGVAVRVDDPAQLRGLAGSFY